MKDMCIYESNRGLGECAGQIEKIRVANKRSAEWKGLEGLKERLQKSGEVPGVCKAHEKRAEKNGFISLESEATRKGYALGDAMNRVAVAPPSRAGQRGVVRS